LSETGASKVFLEMQIPASQYAYLAFHPTSCVLNPKGHLTHVYPRDTFPAEHRKDLRDMLLNLTAFSCTASRPRNALRKLFQVVRRQLSILLILVSLPRHIQLATLGMKLAPLDPTEWPDWLMSCITTFSERNVLTEDILDFLAIVAEEVDTADLLSPKKYDNTL
jgi:hypothetical protein